MHCFGVLTFSINSDGVNVVGSGERTLARKHEEGVSRHYDESSIPSRHLLVPDVAQAPEEVQQTLDFYWADADAG